MRPSADTPLLDEDNNNFSPISEAEEVELPSRPSTLNGYRHQVFLPTPMPGRNTPPAPPPAPPTQPRETLSDNRSVMEVLSALDAMERRLMTELSSTRDEVAHLGRRIDQLTTSISHVDSHGRQYAEHLQVNITSGVNHLAGLISGRRERLQQASDFINELLGQEAPSSSR